jgi:hypothetical protein
MHSKEHWEYNVCRMVVFQVIIEVFGLPALHSS